MRQPKTILITGAGSGLGAALALSYAKLGVILFLCGRREAPLERVSELCKARGAEVFYQSVDVTDVSAISQWIEESNSKHTIELLIANAGISGGTGGIEGNETDMQVRSIFNTNIDGVINSIWPIIPHMQKQRRGQLAIVSSLASFRGMPSAPGYCASKAAIRSYGEGLRGQLKPDGIGVTVICPGYIRTPMTDVNDFPMPMLMNADKAASIIKKKLNHNPPRIAFPFPLYFLIWFLGCLSPRLTDPLFNRLPKKP